MLLHGLRWVDFALVLEENQRTSELLIWTFVVSFSVAVQLPYLIL
jgi:hypothetical protein